MIKARFIHLRLDRSTLFPSDIEEIGGSTFKQSSHNGYTNEDVADNFCEDNDSVDGSIDQEKITNEYRSTPLPKPNPDIV